METQLEGKRINLGAGNMKFSDDAMRKLNFIFVALCLIQFALNFTSYLEGGREFGRYFISACIYFLLSIVFIFKDRLVHSPKSKYAPHFIISKEGLKIKPNIFKKSEFINWHNIKEIELGNYKIGLKFRNSKDLVYYSYRTNKETSIEIKRAIESITSQKGIEVKNISKR